VKSANRVLDLFELLGRWDREMAHAEIAEQLAIPKSSLTPLLRNLVDRGFVEYDHVTKGYRLGAAFVRLSQRAGDRHSLLAIAHPTLEEMTRTTGESSVMHQLSGDDGETVDAVIGPHRLVSHMRVGDRGPLYALSGGKAMLSRMPTDMVEEYLARVEFEAITPHTVGDVGRLRADLDKARRTGYATSIEEFTLGIVGIGMPLIAPDGFPVAALSVVMPAVRFDAVAKARALSALAAATESVIGRIRSTAS
jgi:DNA-binding IclR family transcriptional regulator